MFSLISSLRTTLCALAVVAALPVLSSDGEGSLECSLDRGATLFTKCAVCHNNDNSQTHGVVGPNLYQLMDRPVGKIEGYKFSSVMRKSSNSWTVEHLDAFLKEPMVHYPRTRMAFAGISSAQDRADLICFLSAD